MHFGGFFYRKVAFLGRGGRVIKMALFMTRPIGSPGRSSGVLGTHLGLLAGLWGAPWGCLGLALLAQVSEKVAAETPKKVKKLARNRRLGEVARKNSMLKQNEKV